MKVDQLGLIEAPSSLEASTPPRMLLAGAGVVRVFDSGPVEEDLPGAEYSVAILAGSDGEVIAVVPWAQAACFTGAMPSPGPSGVSMLRLCVESVLADG